MGQPDFYAVELPSRCLRLLDELWPHASQIRQTDRPDLGPLTATFLLSMSMPIINLPIERIEIQGDAPGYADDRHISTHAVASMKEVFKRRLKDAPFFHEDDGWSYVAHKEKPPPNIAHGLPKPLAAELSKKQARDDAANMQISQWRGVLRNSLAHGGVAYLDEEGYSRHGTPVKMFAFASGIYSPKAKRRCNETLIGIRVLRIEADGYRRFLRRWVEWLTDSGIAAAASAA